MEENMHALMERLNSSSQFLQSNDMRVTEVRHGFAKVEMIIDEQILNIHGFVHGGALFSLADTVAGAAIGPEMNGLYEISHKKKNIHLYLPESFEWIVLKSGLIDDREIRKILETPELFIDSKKYFSWERFFTNLLIEKTKNSYLQYRKSAINKTYLHSKNKEKILNCIEAIQW